MESILVKLFEHNRWANLRAVEACAGLTDAQLDATVRGTAGSVRHTLMHIAGAEQRYVMRLSDRRPTYNERDGWRWPGADALRRALDESGRALIELAARADPDEVLSEEGRAAGHDRLRPGNQPRDRAPVPDGDDPDTAGRRAARLLGLGLGQLSSLREVLDRCVRRRGRRCCDGPHPRPVRRRSPGPDPDRPRPAGASAGARPAAGRRGADRGRGRAPVRDGAEPHPRLAGPVSGGRPPGPRRRAALRSPAQAERRGAGVPRGGAGGEPPGVRAAGHGLEHPRPARGAGGTPGCPGLHRDRAPSGAALGLPVPPPPPRPAAPPGPRGGRGGRGGPGVAAKKALAPPANSASFTWTSARSTVTPAWRRCGGGGGAR